MSVKVVDGAVYSRVTITPRIPRGIERCLSIIARYIPAANAIAKRYIDHNSLRRGHDP